MSCAEPVDFPPDYRRKWYIMAAVAMGTFLATIDASIVNVALPTLVSAFESELAIVQWVVLAYLLAVATLMLAVGRLADMFGKKPLYSGGMIIFTLGSLACGLSTSIYMLIAFRVLQAVGAAMVAALGPAIITEAFPPTERGRALGISGATVSVGIVLGPALGGILLHYLSWHWIFFVNLPVGIAGVLLVTRFVPRRIPPGGQRFDFAGAATMFLSLLSLLLALTFAQRLGFTAPPILILLAGFCVFLCAFILIERHSTQPIVDFSLFGSALFSINLITGFMTFVAVAGTLILMPFYLQGILGLDALQTGMLLAVHPIAMGLTAPLSGALSDRVGVRPIVVVGLLTLVGGYVAVGSLDAHTTPLGYALRLLPVGLGMGIFQSPNNSAIMGAAPRAHLGVASSILALTRTLGQTVGTSVLSAVWAGRAMAYVGDVIPGGATTAPSQVQIAALHDTLYIVVVWMVFGLALSIYALWRERAQVAQRLATGQ
ncbi:MAG: DHA2 family efflux MFS transporter permease subunit [Anaerolineae bacterium]|nr:DHA2 family efflux MFS transporter permease subunit [Anaerolineae bacterium]MDW8070144.1 DHA2 family efflux MFS transporter permease subunit [Anaerolineae bacterium]